MQMLHSLGEWRAWKTQNPWVHSSEEKEAFRADIERFGLICPVHGHAGPEAIKINGTNLRETILAFGLNSRTRAVLLVLLRTLNLSKESNRLYAPEATTSLARVLRKTFFNFVGSEYLPTADAQAKHPDVRHEDVMQLSFGDASFDAYVSCEVLEHVPSVELKLKEAARILKPGGALVATFPFSYNFEFETVRARLENGEIVHLMSPEYHGNPVDPSGGSLVFSVPGWDIVEKAKAAGFTGEIGFCAVSSHLFGIRATDTAPVLVFRAFR